MIVDLLNRDPDPAHAAEVLVRRFAIPLDQATSDVTSVISAVHSMNAKPTTRGRRPTGVGLLAVVRSWCRLSWRFRFETLRATVVVLVIELGLKLVDLPTLAKWMRAPLAIDDTLLPQIRPDALGQLTRSEQGMYWAVHWVLDRWLFDPTCLRGALALGWFLRRRHPSLRLGLIDDQAAIAHAWIEVEGRAFNAQPMITALASGRPLSEGRGLSEVGDFL